MVTIDRLKELLYYNPETGIFTWIKRRRGRAVAGSCAGTKKGRGGYVLIGIDGVLYSAHRLAWFYVTGAFPKNQIDHINGVRNDNRLENLREATRSENSQNQRGKHKNNTTGFLGVSKNRHHFMAKIRLGGMSYYLGTHDTPELAHAVYLEAKRKLHPASTI